MVFIFHKNEAYLSYEAKCKEREFNFWLALLGEIKKWRNNGARPIVLVLKMTQISPKIHIFINIYLYVDDEA